jgi:hypothetical protein
VGLHLGKRARCSATHDRHFFALFAHMLRKVGERVAAGWTWHFDALHGMVEQVAIFYWCLAFWTSYGEFSLFGKAMPAMWTVHFVNFF